jgi:hypothetical protein
MLMKPLLNWHKMSDKVRRIQELRRSNAATAVPSKKQYSRKAKHVNKTIEE